MKTSFFLVFFFILIPIYSCNDSKGPFIYDEDNPIALGEYKGTYTCIHDYGSGNVYSYSCETEVKLWTNWYSVRELSYICPPHSTGECFIHSDTITFTDKTIHTCEFDWTLIINGTYHFTYHNRNLIMSQIDTVNTDTTHIRKYIYDLKLVR